MEAKEIVKQMKNQDKIEVLFHNFETESDEWYDGIFLNYVTAIDVDFRINCIVNHPKYGQKEFNEIHPDCVRLKQNKLK